MQKPSLLADLIDIRYQIKSDLGCDSETIRQRDRRIGLQIKGAGRDISCLRAWISAIRKGREGKGQRVQHGLNILIIGLWIFGLVAGWLLCRTALHYDGSAPVNIVHALMILVGSQVLLLLVLFILLITRLERVREALSFVNPALWLFRVVAWMQPAWRTFMQDLLDQHEPVMGRRLRKWLLIYLAQHFAVGINIGIITSLFYLVAISDLAFGWSTTLSMEVETVSAFFSALSLPWHWILSTAVPDMDLIEASRFFRLQTEIQQTADDVAVLGTWWMFLLMSILFYGFIPRILFLLYSGNCYDRALSSSIMDITGTTQVLSRVSLPQVFSTANEPEAETSDLHGSRPLRKTQIGRTFTAIAIQWAGIKMDRRLISRQGFDITKDYSAGGNQTPDQDRELIHAIVSRKPEAVIIVTASWEPPMMEFLDFLKVLREQMDETALRIVFLTPMAGQGEVTPGDIEAWESRLEAEEDPLLYVEAPRA